MGDDTEESKKVFWDNFSVLKTAEQKGIQKGLQQGKLEGVHQDKIDTIHRMNAKGFSVEDIAEIAGLSVDDVRTILG